MKRTIYLVLITLATIACIVGGMLYHSGGFSGLKPDFSGKTETIFQESGAVSEIRLDSEVMDVRFYTGDSLEIAYGGNEKLKPEISFENGVLSITQRGKAGRTFNIFNFGKTQSKLLVTIPADAKLQKFTSQIDVCDLEINAMSAAEAGIHANVGDVDVRNAAFGKTEITANTGDLDVEDSALGSGTIQVNTGDVDINYCSFNELHVTNDVGDTDVRLREAADTYTLNLAADIGDVEAFGRDSGRNYSQEGSGPVLTVQTNIGDIEVK